MTSNMTTPRITPKMREALRDAIVWRSEVTAQGLLFRIKAHIWPIRTLRALERAGFTSQTSQAGRWFLTDKALAWCMKHERRYVERAFDERIFRLRNPPPPRYPKEDAALLAAVEAQYKRILAAKDGDVKIVVGVRS